MHFDTKSYLKNTHNYTAKHALRHIREFYVSYSLISQKDKTISSRISSLAIWKNK